MWTSAIHCADVLLGGESRKGPRVHTLRNQNPSRGSRAYPSHEVFGFYQTTRHRRIGLTFEAKTIHFPAEIGDFCPPKNREYVTENYFKKFSFRIRAKFRTITMLIVLLPTFATIVSPSDQFSLFQNSMCTSNVETAPNLLKKMY
jgi:hypothetical protein